MSPDSSTFLKELVLCKRSPECARYHARKLFEEGKKKGFKITPPDRLSSTTACFYPRFQLAHDSGRLCCIYFGTMDPWPRRRFKEDAGGVTEINIQPETESWDEGDVPGASH